MRCFEQNSSGKNLWRSKKNKIKTIEQLALWLLEVISLLVPATDKSNDKLALAVAI